MVQSVLAGLVVVYIHPIENFTSKVSFHKQQLKKPLLFVLFSSLQLSLPGPIMLHNLLCRKVHRDSTRECLISQTLSAS
jgi:hypothetical protein